MKGMARAIFIDRDERKYVVEVEQGTSLMQAALDNSVPQIFGDCGGACACGTCHVYVDDQWMERVGPASNLEADLIDGLLDTKPSSRLCCQIKMTDTLDGVVLHLPESQP